MTEVPGKGLSEGLARIWEKHRPAVMEQVASLEEAAEAELSGHLDAEGRGVAEQNAHKLAGSVGTFGFTLASELAGEIEHIVGGSDQLSPPDALRFSELVVSLRRALDAERPVGL